MLENHRGNYTTEAPHPTRLQLLWWRFPRESWDVLREGNSMNFLMEPTHRLTPNSSMTEEQTCIAEEFIDELEGLGTLLRVPPGDAMVANGPLFCLPKPGQLD